MPAGLWAWPTSIAFYEPVMSGRGEGPSRVRSRCSLVCGDYATLKRGKASNNNDFRRRAHKLWLVCGGRSDACGSVHTEREALDAVKSAEPNLQQKGQRSMVVVRACDPALPPLTDHHVLLVSSLSFGAALHDCWQKSRRKTVALDLRVFCPATGTRSPHGSATRTCPRCPG
jgi:hypothetical protein